MSTIDTKRLRDLAEKATPGPWEEDDNQPFSRELQGIFAPAQKRYVLKVDFDEQPGNPADAEFIAATDPQTVLALLDEIDRLREQTDSMQMANDMLRSAHRKDNQLLLDEIDRLRGAIREALDFEAALPAIATVPHKILTDALDPEAKP